ncbi:MAG: hypothetical protein FJ319_04145 [SAR202 cluster bacterium]|nr:hypothetical protein [SAR202 cluster bacterium]
MDRVTIEIRTDGEIRASEIIADLRAAAETLYFPMKLVGFWDYRQRLHLCPHEERRLSCPHVLPKEDPAHVPYETTVQRDRKGSLAIDFPHAGTVVYLR